MRLWIVIGVALVFPVVHDNCLIDTAESPRPTLSEIQPRLKDVKEAYGQLLQSTYFEKKIVEEGSELSVEGFRVHRGISVSLIYGDLDASNSELEDEAVEEAIRNLRRLLREKQRQITGASILRAAAVENGQQGARKKRDK